MFEFDPARLRSAMSTRGLTGDTLAKKAKVNRGVITQALRGPVQTRSSVAIVKALKAVPVLGLITGLEKMMTAVGTPAAVDEEGDEDDHAASAQV